MSVLLVVKAPLEKNYSAFWKALLAKTPKNAPGIDVLVSDPVNSSAHLNVIILTLYTQLRHTATEHGFSSTFQIDVLVNTLGGVWQKVYVLASESAPPDVHGKIETIEASVTPVQLKPAGVEISFHQYPTSAVGGTFDHLHDGHKILLLMAAFVASKTVIVGVTGPKLLVKKKYAEVLEPLEKRVASVCSFLQKSLRSGVDFQIYQINDVCGPTGFVRDIDALIISEETALGAEFVNNYRAEHDFFPLKVVPVEVIGGDGSGNAENNWKGKLSSTDLREIEWKKLHGVE